MCIYTIYIYIYIYTCIRASSGGHIQNTNYKTCKHITNYIQQTNKQANQTTNNNISLSLSTHRYIYIYIMYAYIHMHTLYT